MSVFAALVLLFITILLYVIWIAYRVRRLRRHTWAELIQRIQYVDMCEIFSVARIASGQAAVGNLTNEQMLNMLGGQDGLKKLSQNANVMMEIARYLGNVKPELHELALLVRRDAVELRRVVALLRFKHYCSVPMANGRLLIRVAWNYGTLFKNMLRLYDGFMKEMIPVAQEAVYMAAHMESADFLIV